MNPLFHNLTKSSWKYENLHFVEKVASGTRLALTVSFTCDKQFAINDPSKYGPQVVNVQE